jgi:hypothetical protein
MCSRGRKAGNGTGRKCKLATWRKDKTPANQKEKVKCLLKLIFRRNPYVSFIKKNDT